jgi:hypothetical protein
LKNTPPGRQSINDEEEKQLLSKKIFTKHDLPKTRRKKSYLLKELSLGFPFNIDEQQSHRNCCSHQTN